MSRDSTGGCARWGLVYKDDFIDVLNACYCVVRAGLDGRVVENTGQRLMQYLVNKGAFA